MTRHVSTLSEVTGRFGLLLLFIGMLTGTARAQTADDAFRFSERLPGTGARMVGMAGAGTAGFADYGMLLANPAGLGYFQTSQAVGAFGLVSAEEQSRYQAASDEVSPFDQTTSGYGGNLSLVYKFPTTRGSLVFGAGLNQVNTFERHLAFQGETSNSSITETFLPVNSEYAVDEDGVYFPADISTNVVPFVAYEGGAIEFYEGDYEAGEYPFESAVLPGTPITQRGDVVEEGRMTEVNFAGAVEASRGVMIGLGLNIAFGTYFFEDLFIEEDLGSNADYVVFRDGAWYEGLNRVHVRQSFESDLTGINLRGGFSAEVSPGARVGLTLETPTFYQIEETYTLAAVTTSFLDGQQLSYGDQPGDSEGKGEYEYTLRTPWRFGAGLSFNTRALTDGAADLTLLADLELIDWSHLELDSDFDNFSEQNRRLRDDFETVINTRLGLEWRFSDVVARGGFAYQPDPRNQGFVRTSGESTDRSKTFFSAGVGYRFTEELQIDLAWMQERFDDQYVPYTLRGVTTPIVDEDITRNLFRVGVSYSF